MIIIAAAACCFGLGIVFYLNPKMVVVAALLFGAVTLFGFDTMMAFLKDAGVSQDILKAKDFASLPPEFMQGIITCLGAVISGVGAAAFYKTKIYKPKVITAKDQKNRVLKEFQGYDLDIV